MPASVARAKRLTFVVRLKRGEGLTQRGNGVANPVGADVAGRVLPGTLRLGVIQELFAAGGQAQSDDTAVQVILIALNEAPPIQ